MRKAKLIGEAATWQQLNYSRCGRTDKGVSAAGQVNADIPPFFVHGSAGFYFAILQPAAAALVLCPLTKRHIKPASKLASMHVQALLQSVAPARKQCGAYKLMHNDA